jgi:hypothetical protein
MDNSTPVLKRRCDAAQSTYSACQAFLDQLPDDATLEVVEVKADGRDLEEVRARIKTAEAELAALRAVEQRVKDYVREMARPTISGFGKGERLKVIWLGAGWDTRGPREDRAEVLPLMALLFPAEMTAALMREVERMTSGATPVGQRAARIAALEAELAELAYLEEVLVAAAIANGEDVQRSPNALPQAVLGVKVVEATKSSRAA